MTSSGWTHPVHAEAATHDEREIGSSAPREAQVTPGARLALIVLVGMVVISPWPMGSVDPAPVRIVTLVSLLAALVALAIDSARSGLIASPVPLWPLGALWLIGIAQLVPLPEPIHRLVAPASAAVWHPVVPEAAAVLGSGPRPISVHPEATQRTLAFGTGLIALAFAAAPALRERRYLLRAAVAVVASGLAVALYGLVARVTLGDKLYGVFVVPTVAPFGPFVNKNHFAGYVELAALLSVGLAAGLASEARRGPGFLSWVDSSRARYVILAWGCAFVLVLAVPVSLSRGGVVASAAGLLAFVVVRAWQRRRRPIHKMILGASALVLLLVVALAYVLPDVVRERVGTLADPVGDLSGSFRLALIPDVLHLAWSSPWLGSGFGAFEDALLRFKSGAGNLAVQHAENDVLELLAEGGIASLMCAVALLGAVMRTAVGKNGRESLGRGVVAGCVAAMVALLIHSAFDFNLRVPSNALLAATLMAVSLSGASTIAPRTTVPVAALALGMTIGLTLITPGHPASLGATALRRTASAGGSSLRRADAEAEAAAYVQRRPAVAPGWLALAWLRLEDAPAEAAQLAAWATRLDPANEAVRNHSARLGGGGR